LGGDSDTLACITGGIAQAHYGVPDPIADQAMAILDDRLKGVTARFMSRYCPTRPYGLTCTIRSSSLLPPRASKLGEERFGGDAELVGGAGFVPLAFTESSFEQCAFDVCSGAAGNFFQRPAPIKGFRQHAGGNGIIVGPGVGQLQSVGANGGTIGKDDGTLQ